MQHTSKRRASPCGGRPPPPPRVTRARSLSMSLNMTTNLNNGSAALPGLHLVAALDEPAPRGATLASSGLLLSARRPRSDSTMSSDTFDGIYSLGDVVDVDDVDMMSDELCEIDDHVGDVFRPSALLDHKLEDVYTSSCRSRTTSSSSLDENSGRPSDLERMLLISEEEEDDTAAVMAHLARLDSMQTQTRMGEPATTITSTAAHQTTVQQRVSGFCPLLPGDEALLVVASATLVSTTTTTTNPNNSTPCDRHSQHMAIVATLPPKDASIHRRRAHKRTFGEHMASFNFRFATAPSSQLPSPSPSPSPPSPQRRATLIKTAAAKRGRSLFQEAAEDIARRDLDRDEKENHPPAAMPDVAMEKETTYSADGDETKSDMEIENEELTKPEQLPPQTPVRAATSSSASPADASFQTPLRRSVTMPAATTCSHSQAAAASTFLTPSSAATATSKTSTVMSPAPSFDKIAVVHAKDTPGRVDKFEWTIRPREAIRAKTALFTTATPSQQQRQLLVEPLPPRYLVSDASASSSNSSPPKRRIHSTTFGSFARSFSFTASNH